MFIYNKITELRYDQFLILLVVEILIILVTLLLFKKKLSLKLILYSLIIAIVLSLLSTLIVNGFYGGTAYHERFGWPFQIQGISRNIEGLSTPWGFRFYIWKFFANTIYWGLFPLSILFEIFSKKKSKKFQLFIITSLTFYFFFTLFFSYINNPNRSKGNIEEAKTTSSIERISESTDLEKRKKEAIEKEYTEFKDFDITPSFAGTSIETTQQGNDYYFAYIVHGSGVPIALATCFRVDRMFRVYKVGEFPDYLDSYAGYTDIDPITCSGIKD